MICSESAYGQKHSIEANKQLSLFVSLSLSFGLECSLSSQISHSFCLYCYITIAKAEKMENGGAH